MIRLHQTDSVYLTSHAVAIKYNQHTKPTLKYKEPDLLTFAISLSSIINYTTANRCAHTCDYSKQHSPICHYTLFNAQWRYRDRMIVCFALDW